ncbi:MAG: hypothetical protein ABSE48_00645 [Verrucomicrobiota bacterium]|jgi:t-SNARE complex subunit (syntaxin)
MPSGDSAEEDVSPEERIAIAKAKAAKRTVEIFWLITILAILIFVVCLCAALMAGTG